MNKSLALLAVLTLPALAFAKEPRTERSIEAAHKGRILKVENVQNPEFFDWTLLMKPFTVKGESGKMQKVTMVDVIEHYTRFLQPLTARLALIARERRFDPAVITFIEKEGKLPEGLTGEAKTQLCEVVTRVEDQANILIGIPRYDGGFVAYDETSRVLRAIRAVAIADWRLQIDQPRPAAYPCD